MFEPFGTMAPIPELAGRRAAPPIDLSQCHALFGRKENKRAEEYFLFANTFLRINFTGDILLSRLRRELCPNALRNFRIFALEFFAGSLLYL